MLATFLAVSFIASYVGVGALAVKTVSEGPAFERKSSRFDLRLNYGTHVHLFNAKPAPVITWQTPEEAEAVDFPVATTIRVKTHLGYTVESM